MAFTTWTALHQTLLDRLADFAEGKAFIASKAKVDTGAGSREVEYRDIGELQEAIEFAATMAAFESGKAVVRTYARPGRPR